MNKVKIALISPRIALCDPEYNASVLAKEAASAAESGAGIIVFPELALTGATAGDLYFQEALTDAADAALSELCDAIAELDALCFVGLPVRQGDRLYNAVAAIYGGEIVGVSAACGYNSAISRFSPAPDGRTAITVGGQHTVLGGDLVYGAEKHPQNVIDGLKATVALWEENVKKTQQKEKLEKDIQVATQDLEDTKQRYDVDRITKQKEENITNLKNVAEQQLAEIATKKASAKNESKAKMQQLLESTDKAKSELESLKFQDVDDFDYSAVSTISSNIASLTTTKNITLKNIKSLESGVCPTCGSNCTHKLQDFQKELSDTDAQIKTLEQDLQKTLEQQKVFEEAKKFNENALNRKSKLENEISNTDVNIEAEKKNILTLLQSLKEKETLLNEKLASDIQNAETSAQTQIEASKELIAQKKKYVEDLDNQLSEIKIVDVADCREELDRCEKENAEIDNIISYNKAIREQNEAVKLQQVQDKVEKENLEKKLIDVKKSLANYTTSSELLSRTYPTWKLERDLKSIENKTNLFVEDIYEPLYIKFVANKNSLKMSYGEGGRDIPVRKLSGAEKQIVNLAVENTFNQQQNLSCLILDECDSAMDKENKDAFFNTLLSLPDYYNQILVITHDEKVKDVLQAEGANIVMIG